MLTPRHDLHVDRNRDAVPGKAEAPDQAGDGEPLRKHELFAIELDRQLALTSQG